MAESLPAKKARARKIMSRLARVYPDARTELGSTPRSICWWPPSCPRSAPTSGSTRSPRSCSRATAARRTARPCRCPDLERLIHSTGFFRAKARSISGMARPLVERHGGEVPATLDELVALPGVGRKTANVVLGNAFGIPALAVDTHVFRVSQRLGLARGDDPEKIHDQLCQVLPAAAAGPRRSHLLILHGRRVCCRPEAGLPQPARSGRSAHVPGKTKAAKPVKAAARHPPRGVWRLTLAVDQVDLSFMITRCHSERGGSWTRYDDDADAEGRGDRAQVVPGRRGRDRVLGRLATQVATILRGKHKSPFTPHLDVGDHVVVINAEKIHLTGRKLTDKIYRWHAATSVGCARCRSERMIKTHPERVIEWAVQGMLPKNRLGRAMAKKLKVYKGAEHPHAAQKPEPLATAPRAR